MAATVRLGEVRQVQVFLEDDLVSPWRRITDGKKAAMLKRHWRGEIRSSARSKRSAVRDGGQCHES
jgi:hypothetical protein